LPGDGPGVIFCTGFKSDMTGGKALALESWCAEAGRQFTRFDYQGHGASSGTFEDGTIGEWKADAMAVLDEVTSGSQIVVGSSMGGWIAFLLAVARTERIAGIVGIAPAVDFTQALLWPRMTDEARQQIEEEGVWYRPSEYDPEPYPITRTLIEEGRNNLLMPGPIPFRGPVRLIHGMLDEAVPWEHSLKIADAVASDDVELSFVKDGEHRLSRDSDLDRLISTVQNVIGRV
jgi:pimeloyl-ACP methyl ester carboxylesterase